MSIFTMGVDVGSTASKCVIIKDGKEIVATAVVPVGTGTSGPARVMKGALEQVGLTSIDQLDGAVATGYGRNSLQEVPAQMSELSCHAKGAYFLFPRVRTIIDIGGQDSKALKLSDNGMLENFVMNDKCAAGTGQRCWKSIWKTLKNWTSSPPKSSQSAQPVPSLPSRRLFLNWQAAQKFLIL